MTATPEFADSLALCSTAELLSELSKRFSASPEHAMIAMVSSPNPELRFEKDLPKGLPPTSEGAIVIAGQDTDLVSFLISKMLSELKISTKRNSASLPDLSPDKRCFIENFVIRRVDQHTPMGMFTWITNMPWCSSSDSDKLSAVCNLGIDKFYKMMIEIGLKCVGGSCSAGVSRAYVFSLDNGKLIVNASQTEDNNVQVWIGAENA